MQMLQRASNEVINGTDAIKSRVCTFYQFNLIICRFVAAIDTHQQQQQQQQ